MSEQPRGATGVPGPAIAGLSTELGRYGRMLHLLKAHLSPHTPQGLDWAASALLVHLVRCGPRRQGELADTAMLDPSTVSRYVAHLVREGLVERRPDPEDGRAVQLVATAAGHAAQQRVAASRDDLLHRALCDWDPQDVTRLTDLLGRFNNDMEALRVTLPRPAATGPNAQPTDPQER